MIKCASILTRGLSKCSGGSKGVGQQARAPLKSDQLCFLLQFFYQNTCKNKAQVARESIKTTYRAPGPLSGPWTLAESEFGFALVMCVRAHSLLRPWGARIFSGVHPTENPGSAPENGFLYKEHDMVHTNKIMFKSTKHVTWCSIFQKPYYILTNCHLTSLQ